MNSPQQGKEMASAVERNAMRRAIVLSAFGLGTTSPNPPVGCVILDADGRLVGEGYHERKGEPHAETQALTAAGEQARGGTAVVTLEPCNHHGRTPACRQALIEAGITRVIISIIDPTSRGEGGAADLRNSGVEVEVGVLDDETRLVLGPWLVALERKRPFVTLAYTVHADGSVGGLPRAAHTTARELVMDAHNLRLIHDAVLLGDSQLEETVPSGHGQDVFNLPGDTPQEVSDLFVSLIGGGVRSLLVDGICPLTSSFLDADLVDQAVAYVENSGPSNPQQASTDTQRFAGLVSDFALRNVTRVGRAIRVSSVRQS